MSRQGDRLSVLLFSLTAFLLVLALLGSQLGHAHSAAPRTAVLVRKIYRTTVLERVIGAQTGGSNSTSVSQSAAVSGGYAPGPALGTRTS